MASSSRVAARQVAFVGLFSAAICFAWSWRPSYWLDEAASLSAATRSPGQLWDLTQRRDVVHGLYYFTLHWWVGLFGTGEVAARSLSAVGIAVACGGVTVLGQQLAGRELGLAAGLISAVLPGLSWAGAEAREYSWSSAGAVVVSILLVRALRGESSWDWVFYAVALAVATYVFYFCILLLIAHLATLLLLRRPLRPWLAAAGGAIVLASPILYAGWKQRGQVQWIEISSVTMMRHVGLRQFFLSTRAGHWFGVAVVAAWLLAAVSVWLIVTAVRAWRRGESTGLALALALPWALLPTIMIVGYSLLDRPIYQERYLTFTTPGLALAVGAGLLHLRRRPVFLTACLLLAVLPLPMLVQQKAVASRSGEDYRALAGFVRSQSADTAIFVLARARSVRIAYPQDFKHIREPTLLRGPVESISLWGVVGPVDRLPFASLTGRRVALFLTASGFGPGNPSYQWLLAQGCRPLGSIERSTFGVVVLGC